MIQETPQADHFKQQMRTSLLQETIHSRSVTIAKHDNVYTCGDNDELVYFIENGQIKLLMLSPEGRECLLAIHSDGDIFGELCLSGLGARLETATAMKETVVKQVPCPKFFARLDRDKLFEGFVRYLAVRIADQQQVIANLVTVDSEQRLGKTLLTPRAHTRQKRPAKHPHRAQDHTRGVVGDGGNDTSPDQCVYAAIQESGAARDKRRSVPHYQRKEAFGLPRTDRLTCRERTDFCNLVQYWTELPRQVT